MRSSAKYGSGDYSILSKTYLTMSKIGKKIIIIPEGVEVKALDQVLNVKGPKGELTLNLHPDVTVDVVDDGIKVGVKDPENRLQRALWGTFRSLVQNNVTGVIEGFEKRLEIVGVGYKAEVSSDKLTLNVGYSHPVELEIPDGLEVKVEKNKIFVSGIDRQAVGQFASQTRAVRKPEPYKGKGIKYEDEIIRRKAGKVVKAVGGAPGA